MHSTNSTPGRMGYPGKWPSNTGECRGTSARARIVPAAESTASMRSIIWKYSRRMKPAGQIEEGGGTRGSRGSGRLRRPQILNVRAEIAQDEIVVDRALALVDVLHPFFDRHLDAKALVDGESHIQEVQAVDAQIVDRVGGRLDRRSVDIASLRNDIRDGAKGFLHDLPLVRLRGWPNRGEF